jgi:hypothetical protein
MLKLKTNKPFNVPTERGVIESVIKLIVENIFIDKNSIKVSGYYYRLDENNQVIKLSSFGANSTIQKETLDYLEENVLPQLGSVKSTFSNLFQRIKEVTLIQIEQEAPENYGTYAADWIDDIDEEIPQ